MVGGKEVGTEGQKVSFFFFLFLSFSFSFFFFLFLSFSFSFFFFLFLSFSFFFFLFLLSPSLSLSLSSSPLPLRRIGRHVQKMWLFFLFYFDHPSYCWWLFGDKNWAFIYLRNLCNKVFFFRPCFSGKRGKKEKEREREREREGFLFFRDERLEKKICALQQLFFGHLFCFSFLLFPLISSFSLSLRLFCFFPILVFVVLCCFVFFTPFRPWLRGVGLLIHRILS